MMVSWLETQISVVSPDWPDMVRYARSLNVDIKYVNDKAMALIKGTWCENQWDLQKKLYQLCLERHAEASKELTVQGRYLNLENVHIKSSHSIYHNWKVDDALVIFTIKARLSILPTNFTLHLWNGDHNPECLFCHRHTESVVHILNGCNKFKNFHTRRHDRIVNKIAEFIKENKPRARISSNLLAETIFPEFQEEIKQIVHRKP